MKYIVLINISLLFLSCKTNKFVYNPSKVFTPKKQILSYQPIKPATVSQDIIKGTYNAVYFAYNSFQIDAVYKKNLSTIANYLKTNLNYSLEVFGHTDSRGSKKYNQKLSEKRANAVKNYLVSLGINSSRIKVTGLSFTKPYRKSKSPRDRAYNRRVEVHFVKN